jgi:hypothetical protein
VLALWVGVAIVAAGLILLLMHDRKGGPRADVASYITEVNATSAGSTREFATVQRAFQAFALTPKSGSKQGPKLRAAAASLHALRLRIQAIPAPEPAAVLRRRLIALYRQQEAVAAELVGVNDYVPRLTAAERDLAPANNRMQAVLKTKATTAEQAAALSAYADALAEAERRVKAIDPPLLFRASHRAQAARLGRSARLMRQLGGALSRNDRKGVQAAITELGKPGDAGNAAARKAVIAYNHRVARIRTLAAQVEIERLKLNKSLQ